MQTNLNSADKLFVMLLFTQIRECLLKTKDFDPRCSSPSIWLGLVMSWKRLAIPFAFVYVCTGVCAICVRV